MAGSVSDEAFARAAQQAGMASFDDIEVARAVQAESAQQGMLVSLPDLLVQQGIITARQRETLEAKVAAQQAGGVMQLGPYTLLKKIGEGGMGAVYLADDTSVGRKVAVKVLPKKYSAEREFLARFRREAQATGKLNHVNIVMAYNVAEEAGTHYYAMEYCEGETLDTILKRQHVIPWDAAVATALQVARGLKHAHDHGIIHRDIKPTNVFVCKPLGTPEGVEVPEPFAEGFVAKILDLGLSKSIGGTAQSFYTQTGVALGTPHYVSPEQAKGEKTIDGRTDIYSLGAMLYHLVTGQTPFSGSTAAIVMMKHLDEQLTNPQDINAEIPDGVAHVIMKMMAKEPNDRYANCKELLDDLELVLDGKMPSSQAIDVGRSSVAVARVVRSRDRKGAVPLADAQHARGSESPRGTRQPEPVLSPVEGEARRERGEGGVRVRRDAGEVPLVEVTPATSSRTPLYVGAGVVGLGLLVLIVVLAMSSGDNEAETRKPKSEESGTVSGQSSVVSGEKPPSAVAQPETRTPTPETRPAPAQPEAANPKPETGVTDAWIKAVQALPAEEQVKKVKDKLREMNPATYKVLATPKIEGGKVVEFTIETPIISDISPLRALKDLKTVGLAGTKVSDLSPLAGMPLEGIRIDGAQVTDLSPLRGMRLKWMYGCGNAADLAPLKGMPLDFLDCGSSKVSDLAPLAGMPLTNLDCAYTSVTSIAALKGMKLTRLSMKGTQVSDLSPLEGMPMKRLHITGCACRDLGPISGLPLEMLECDAPERHLGILRQVKSLQTINGMPVAEFWKKYPTDKLETRNPKLEGNGKTETGKTKPAGVERPWKPIFDGKTLECLDQMGNSDWRVEDGAIVNVPGRQNAKFETRTEFGAGELRIRLDVRSSSWLEVTAFQRKTCFTNARTKAMIGREQELLCTCRGDDVTTSLGGQLCPSSVVGRGTKGRLRVLVNDGILRILSIEYRELGPGTPAGGNTEQKR